MTKRIIGGICLCLGVVALLSVCALASPPVEIRDKNTITTQVVTNDGVRKQKYPYPNMITGESLVALLYNMIDFKVPNSSIVFNRATQQLFIRNTPANQEQIRRILQSLRENRPKQIVIEARFIEVTDFDGWDAGLRLTNFTYTGENNGNNRIISTSGSMANFAAGSWTSANALAAASEALVQTAVTTKDFDVDAALRALAQRAKLNTLSAPKLTCMNNQRANIRIATSKNYVEEISSDVVGTTSGTTTSVDVTVNTAQNGVSLDVTPSINFTDNTITLELHPSVVSVDLSDTQTIESGNNVSNAITLPKFVNQTLDTTVTVPDGGTAILGGLITETQKNDVRRVPLLGDIPLLGSLFKTKTVYTDKSNLLIFITARIVNEQGRAGMPQ